MRRLWDNRLWTKLWPWNWGLGHSKVTESCTIRSADSENPTLEPNITSIANRLRSYGHFCKSKKITRHTSATILDFIEPQIAPFDLPKISDLSVEPNVEWIRCTVCVIFAFKLYCDLETGVRGHSRSSKAALLDRAHTTLYSSSIVSMPLSITIS